MEKTFFRTFDDIVLRSRTLAFEGKKSTMNSFNKTKKMKRKKESTNSFTRYRIEMGGRGNTAKPDTTSSQNIIPGERYHLVVLSRHRNTMLM